MNLGLGPLLQRLANDAPARCVLATVSETEGSSYRKPGAMMLLCDPLPPVGLVSGGCLESDLAEHARRVLADGVSRLITYDLSRDDDALWGLGIGCGGRITVLLECISAADGYGGLSAIDAHWREGRFCWIVKRVDESERTGSERYAVFADGESQPVGFKRVDTGAADRNRATRLDEHHLLVPVNPPPRLLICGAGPDALPLAQMATQCGWRVDVVDHRPAYASAALFPGSATVTCAPVECMAEHEATLNAQAAVVMSHHLENDANYARALAVSNAAYIGVLGPTQRGEEVLARAGVDGDERFFSPAGLDIGADLPESIALSILAEAHAVLYRRRGGSMNSRD